MFFCLGKNGAVKHSSEVFVCDWSFGTFFNLTTKPTLTEAYVPERRSAARVLYVSIGLAPAAARAGLITPPCVQTLTRFFCNVWNLYNYRSA